MSTKRWIVLVACFIVLVLLVLPAQIRPANFLPDDTYYYLQVAHNIADGRGSTFNQIVPTNGYHPLWMLFCVAGMLLSGGDKAIALHVVPIIQVLLFLGVISFFIRIARTIGLRHWQVGLPILAIYFLTGLYGSEAHLNALTALAGISYMLSAIEGRARNWLICGLLTGLAVLARLDNVFLVAAIVVAGLTIRPRGLRGATPREAALFLIGVLVLVGPYLIYNEVTYGHMIPISGAIKSSFPAIHASVGRLALLGGMVTVFAAFGIVLSFMGAGTSPQQAMHRMVLRVLGMAVLLQSAYIVLFLEFGAGWSWYYVLGVLNTAFVVVSVADTVLDRIARSNPRGAQWLAGAFIGLLLVAGIARGWLKLTNPYFPDNRSAAEVGGDHDLREKLGYWMKEHLPAGSGLMVEEGAGAIAYYSNMRILPLDGLIADYSYNDGLLRLGAARYLALHSVDYYVGTIDPRDSATQHAYVVAPLYRRVAGTLELERSNILMQMQDGNRPFKVGVWKIAAN